MIVSSVRVTGPVLAGLDNVESEASLIPGRCQR
jgi:hypothetical protein